jgi:hypothetical protein
MRFIDNLRINGWHPKQQIHAKAGKERILKLAITE